MKKFFALLALVLGVVSCQTEGFDVNVGGEQDVNITVSLPEGTRADSALGAFQNIDMGQYDIRYIFQVFNAEGTVYKTKQVICSDAKTVSFPVRLIPNRTYNFVVWADLVKNGETENAHYTIGESLKEITLNKWAPMDESRDAYTGKTSVVFNGDPIKVNLTRPFAKLRVKTTDMNELLGVVPAKAKVTYLTEHYTSFNAVNQTPGNKDDKAHDTFEIVEYTENEGEGKMTLFTDYFFATAEQEVVNFTLEVFEANEAPIISRTFNTSIPVKRNNLTTIEGDILTMGDNITVEVKPEFVGAYDETPEGDTTTTVNNAEDFNEAFVNGIENIILGGDINLNDLLTRAAADPSFTIAAGKTLSIDLNGNKLSATSTQTGKNYNMFDVRGTLTVKNGTMEYEHLGENMGWGSSTNLFNVTAGGVLNLEGVTAKNLGGSDMGFVAHLNNWGEVTLNVENSTLESNYVAVRVFNSGYDMNNVTIKNSTLKGNSAAFWVHNYTVADFGTEEKAEAQKALLNFDIYNGTNTFSPDLNGVRYGFTNSVRTDAYGITKSVSEDGSEVTLGSIVENGLVRRGVAGTEENTTIKKVIVEEGVGVLYDRTFRRFYALEEVVLPSTLTTIGAAGSGVFQSCTNLKSIVLPESVTVLGKGSFQECSSLESINIPAGVTRIEADALRATGLVSVEFHEGVTYFGAQAFRDCKQLTEVIINAPEFTMEGNTFGITAAPFTPMTIYVANAEMKTYVESKLTAHAKTYITVVAPNSVASKEDLPVVADGKIDTTFEEDVNLYGDITVSANETNANSGYGATGVAVTNGAVLNGQGHTLTVNNAWDTWDCVVAAQGGTIKNLTVSGAMRGIFMPGANGDVFIDNVIFDNVIYTFNSDAGNKNYGVYISNSTLNGWTSHSDVHKEVVYTNCSFGEGNGYAFCRPYGPTSFIGCDFAAGFEVEAIGKITFENCTLGGVALTADNLSTLVTSGTIANATVK